MKAVEQHFTTWCCLIIDPPLACVASVPVRTELNRIARKSFSHSGRANNGARTKSRKKRDGGLEKSEVPFIPYPHPASARIGTLATQANLPQFEILENLTILDLVLSGMKGLKVPCRTI